MAAEPDVLEMLNGLLTNELTSVNQYYLHSELYSFWGFERLGHAVREESLEEMRNAEHLVRRILLLGGHPNLQRLGAVSAGETVPEGLRLDLELERTAVTQFRAGIDLCLEHRDHGTREAIEPMLVREEQYVEWLETQLALVDQLGEQLYLAEQLHS